MVAQDKGGSVRRVILEVSVARGARIALGDSQASADLEWGFSNPASSIANPPLPTIPTGH